MTSEVKTTEDPLALPAFLRRPRTEGETMSHEHKPTHSQAEAEQKVVQAAQQQAEQEPPTDEDQAGESLEETAKKLKAIIAGYTDRIEEMTKQRAKARVRLRSVTGKLITQALDTQEEV